MSSILIRGVPDEIHLRLRNRAGNYGKSLQQYLLGELTRLAETPTLEEALERIESRVLQPIDMEAVVRDLDEERRNRM